MNYKEFCLRLKLQKGLGYQATKTIINQVDQKKSEINIEQVTEMQLENSVKAKATDAMKNIEFGKYIKKVSSQCDVITIFDEIYPENLKEIYNPPFILFAYGNLKLLKKRITVIVGSRIPTEYSRIILKRIIPDLINQNYVIASGLAKGVDSIAHEETLLAKGNTIAVLGNGLNYYYPKTNTNLQLKIKNHGLVLSEYLPDTPPRPFRFPERNRILAGLSENVIVTEAKKKSGSLITANYALEANRNIFAVPGPLTSSLSEGPNYLIAAGAMPIVNCKFENLL